jgi:phosphatidylglycerophosphate synthase
VRPVQPGPVIGLFGQLVLLTALAATVGLGGFGWLIGIGCGTFSYLVLTRALAHRGAVLGPADEITLIRAILAGGVAALAADSFGRPLPVRALVALAVVTLVLDAVDGQVARRTNTASELGARFDMEVDAFLILVLSVHVARTVGPWVLAIGAARYAFVAAGWVVPALRGSPPPRYWCKVVAAVQGIGLTVAAAAVLPGPVIAAALVVALALLAESFGRDVWWLMRRSEPRRGSDSDQILVRPAPSLVCSGVAGEPGGGA